MSEPDPQDVRDVERVLAGDDRAFEGLVERHGRRVFDLARRMLRDPHEAEDVVQHAFLNAYTALERFDPARPFRHWILRIASNLCRNRIAARKVRHRLLPPTGHEDPPPEPAAAIPPQPDGRAPSVLEALEALPERYRLPMVLRYVHELSLEEISEATDVPVATIKTHLHRGRAAVRALLEAGETPGAEGGTTGRSP